MGFAVGSFWIRGDWDDSPTPDGFVPIIMPPPPRRVFGAGWHPATKAALLALEQDMRPGFDVADIGCGTGIVAVAACKLGAGYVYASDIYPRCREAVEKIKAANNVDFDFSEETYPPSKVDLVICTVGDRFVEENRHMLMTFARQAALSVRNDYSVEVLV